MNRFYTIMQKEIVNKFIENIGVLAHYKSCLQLDISNFSLFSVDSMDIRIIKHYGKKNEIKNEEKFDLLLGDLPLGLNRVDIEFAGKKIKIRKNWAEILDTLSFLKPDGLGIFLIEPISFAGNEGSKIASLINSKGYFINAIINAPEGILKPHISITPVFVIISANPSFSVFVGELLNKTQVKELSENYLNGVVGEDLKYGMQVALNKFKGFHQIKIHQQIDKLETQYKEYEKYTLGELAVEINYVRSGNTLTEKNNSIYIPKIGTSPVISKLSEATIKHHNYFQVVLGSKAINGYVVAFYRSDLGKLILQSLISGTFIPQLNKKSLEESLIALPEPNEQKRILTTQKKLYSLKKAIDLFDAEIALNPTSSSHILGQLDSMLDAINGLTDADRIKNTVRQGESKTVEFKETFSLDIKKKSKEKYIEKSSLKTIVAFLNTDGGVLLIGVDDDGNIRGVDAEITQFYKGNLDKYLLDFKNKIKIQIGEEFYPFFEYKAIKVDNSTILMVECNKSTKPCFLGGTDFFVRTNPATDKLDGPKLVEYVNNHFGS